MNPQKVSSSKAWAAGAAITGLALVAGLFFARAYFGQNKNPLVDQAGPPAEIKGLFDDWTTHHIVFPDTSDPGVLEKAQRDPRWWMQQLKRHSGQGGNALNFHNGGSVAAVSSPPFPGFGPYASILPPLLANPMKGLHAPWAFSPANSSNGNGNNKCKGADCATVDWSMSLGGNSGDAQADGAFPAKFGFSATSAPTCSDFLVLVERGELAATKDVHDDSHPGNHVRRSP